MNCEEVQALLPDYYDDELSPITRYGIQKHLKGCAACSKELEEISLLFVKMAASPIEIPPESVKEGFYQMLEAEMKKEEKKRASWMGKILSIRGFSAWLRIAAILVIFIGGFALGYFLRKGWDQHSRQEYSELKKQVNDVQEVIMFKLLEQESASERIWGVNYANDMSNPDQRVISAMLKTLNQDKNVNVRLASLYALSKFSDRPEVTDSLVGSLSKQTEPVIQIVLINMLADKKEAKAKKPIEDILSDQKTMKEVKDIAAKKLKSL
jgi:hypothetical protein